MTHRAAPINQAKSGRTALPLRCLKPIGAILILEWPRARQVLLGLISLSVQYDNVPKQANQLA